MFVAVAVLTLAELESAYDIEPIRLLFRRSTNQRKIVHQTSLRLQYFLLTHYPRFPPLYFSFRGQSDLDLDVVLRFYRDVKLFLVEV